MSKILSLSAKCCIHYRLIIYKKKKIVSYRTVSYLYFFVEYVISGQKYFCTKSPYYWLIWLVGKDLSKIEQIIFRIKINQKLFLLTILSVGF